MDGQPVSQADQPEDLEADPVVPGGSGSTRRSILVGAAAAVGAAAVQALAGGAPVAAASAVQLGATNTTTKKTVIQNSATTAAAVGFSGRVTFTGPGATTIGVEGITRSKDGNGVLGRADKGHNAYGVWGAALHGTGVFGNGRLGVHGVSVDGSDAGVKGTASIYGVYGEATDTESVTYALWGESPDNGYAAYFHGDTYLTGTAFQTTAAMMIDHPQAPAERTLSHAAVHSPDMLNVYNGTVRLDASGTAKVRLPRYFAALNKDARFQLTALGGAQPNLHIASEVRRGAFQIAGGTPGGRVCWQVTGVRRDAFANAKRIAVESRKPDSQRGTYLNPAVHGQPQSTATHQAPRSASNVEKSIED